MAATEDRKSVNGDVEAPHVTVQVTPEQLQRLHREVEETKWLTHAVMQVLIGKEKSDRALDKIREWLDDDTRRFDQGTPVYVVTAAYEKYMKVASNAERVPHLDVEGLSLRGPQQHSGSPTPTSFTLRGDRGRSRGLRSSRSRAWAR